LNKIFSNEIQPFVGPNQDDVSYADKILGIHPTHSVFSPKSPQQQLAIHLDFLEVAAAFIIENTSSMGFSCGLYGGRNLRLT